MDQSRKLDESESTMTDLHSFPYQLVIHSQALELALAAVSQLPSWYAFIVHSLGLSHMIR